MTKQEYYDLLVKSAHDGTFPCLAMGPRMMEPAYLGVPDAIGRPKSPAGLLMDAPGTYPDPSGLADEQEVIGLMTLPDGMTPSDVEDCEMCHFHWHKAWSPKYFIRDINSLKCFTDVNRVGVTESHVDGLIRIPA